MPRPRITLALPRWLERWLWIGGAICVAGGALALAGNAFRRPVHFAGWRLTPLESGAFLLAGALLLAFLLDHGRRRLDEMRERLLSIVESTDDGIVGKDLDGRITSWNHGAEVIFGWKTDEIVGRPITTLIPPERHAEEADILQRLARGERIRHYSTERVRKDGRRILVSATISPIRDPQGRIVGASKIVRDITEVAHAAEALRASETKLQHLLTHSPALIYSLRIEGGQFLPVVVSENIERILGYTVEEARSPEWWATSLHPDDRERAFANAARMVEQGGDTIEYRIRHKDGTYRWFEDSNRTIHSDGGRAEAVGVLVDVTERRIARESLSRSEERFRQLAENIREVFWMTDPAKNEMLYVSPAYERIWQRSCRSLYESPRTWIEAIHPEDRPRVIAAAETRQVLGTYDEEYRITTPDGAVRWIHDRATPIRDADGQVYRIAGVAEDITESRKLEEQYRQAQKMEAIGQLAGGVAHDFNNLLTVITGHAGLVTMSPAYDPSLEPSVSAIQAASDRAAALTRQLLAFSRRQTMLPRDLDLNQLLADITKMMQRLIGETVRVELHFAPQPLVVHADGGMLDQIVLNLAVNARDAMPNGGRLILETAAIELDGTEPVSSARGRRGPFACLSVSDTGVGIPADVLPRIFEPFFTTKETGRGTGLGLATVYGIVDQHRGWVTVYSEPGRGTTFRVYLPRVLRDAPLVRRTSTPAPMPR